MTNKDVQAMIDQLPREPTDMQIITISHHDSDEGKYYVLEYPVDLQGEYGVDGDFERWESVEQLFEENSMWIGEWAGGVKPDQTNIPWKDEVDDSDYDSEENFAVVIPLSSRTKTYVC